MTYYPRATEARSFWGEWFTEKMKARTLVDLALVAVRLEGAGRARGRGLLPPLASAAMPDTNSARQSTPAHNTGPGYPRLPAPADR